MRLTTLLTSALVLTVSVRAQPPLRPVVEVEEDVYTYQPADNGAGPVWCYGSTCLVGVGRDVFISGLETLPGVQPLNNVRWMLLRRTDGKWEVQQRDEKGRTREPCPLACFPHGSIFLSANPTLTGSEALAGPAQPQVLAFSTRNLLAPHQVLIPTWQGNPTFTEHSYRAFAADGPQRELILLNILGHECYHWSFRNRAGNWSAQGRLAFPWGADYEQPQSIRLCYPEIVLQDRAVHFLGVSDIVEPVKAWRDYKRQLTGREWDYDFRRLFYTWTPDITKKPFANWLEVASREATCGWITNLDLWVAPDGTAHLLWLEKSLDQRLREKFFPNERLTIALQHCTIRSGEIADRQTLHIGGEGESSEIPGHGRFHVTRNGRLFVLYYVSGTDEKGNRLSENRLLEIYPERRHSAPLRVDLKCPFTNFFTATTRGGTRPSDIIDLYGDAAGAAPNTLRYARIRLTPG